MRDDKVPMWVRVFLPVHDSDAELPDLTARLDYTFKEFGNDIVRVAGVGEWLIPNKLQRQQPLPDFYTDSVRAVAERGWIYKQHMVALEEQKAHLDVWEKVNKDIPLADLHWSMDHFYGIDQETIDRAIDLGIGISSHSARYLEGMVQSPGAPPFRMILDSNLMVGGGSDGARISTMNPWNMLYFAVTGKNHAGEQINPGQSISRREIVRIWTQPQGWFCKEEKKNGAIEVGKFSDFVVLSDNFFDEQVVPDEQIRKLSSVLTVVDGKVVHDTGVL